MKRKSAWLSFTACALTAASAATVPAAVRPAASSPASAQSARTANLSSVELVNCSGGLTGFFDKASGKLFLYDSTLSKCVGVRRVTQLGAPLETVEERE